MSQAPPGNSTSLPPFALAVEERARGFLAQGKWRKARDEIKPLVKADRERYLPLLIQANLGLVREMTAKGQHAEARQVMEHLATMATSDQLRAAQLEMAGYSGTSEVLLDQALATLANSANTLSEPEKIRLADQVVLAFAPVPGSSPVQEQLGVEVRAVHEALQAAGNQQWERAAELLRPISHRSPVGHWAAFVKGVAAFHGRDTERAARLFERLPEGSVPAKASLAYRVLLRCGELPKEKPKLAEVVLEGVCRLLAQPGAGPRLWPAERLWRQGRYTESYRVFRDGVPQFPTADPSWLGALSEFYFQAPHAMAFEQRDDYLQFFEDLSYRRSSKNKVEEMCLRRLLALTEVKTDSQELREDWEGFIQAREQVHGANPKLASLAYGWLGEQLSKVPAAPSFFGFGPDRRQLRDAGGARHCLLKAIELDPGNLAAQLQLSLVYAALHEVAKRNRLLDEMVKRFPEEKPVLLENAAGCIQRKAYTKGLDYLERARRLDRLDPSIPIAIVSARRRLARQQFQRRQIDTGRKTLEPIEEFLNDHPADLNCSRWTAWMRQGLLEQMHGDGAQGAELLGRARAASPFPAAFLFFAHTTHRQYAQQRRGDSPFLPELRAELKQKPTTARAAVLLRMFRYWDKSGDAPPDSQPLDSEAKLLREYLKGALKQPFTRAEAREVVELCHPEWFEEQARAFLKAMLRRDPRDPWFRLSRYLLDQQSRPWEFEPLVARPKLQSILDEARQRGEHELIPKLQGLIKSLDRPPPLAPFPFPDEPDFEDEDAFDEGPGAFEGGLPDLPAKIEAEMSELLAGMAGASEAELRALRKTMAKEVPDFVFDMLLKAAKSRTLPPMPLPPTLPPPKPHPKWEPQLPNPDQQELF